MRNRQALEDAVFNLYPDLDMPEIERMESDKLEWLLEVKQERRSIPRPADAPPRKKAAAQWEKTGAGYEVRYGVLVHVEKWRVANEAGETVRDYVQHCGERVFYDGRMVSSSILHHFLTTGEWVKRIPRPKRYRAVLRRGRDVLHLGYYPSKEERDTVVGLARLGVFPNGSNNA